jgi:hypothetical protein
VNHPPPQGNVTPMRGLLFVSQSILDTWADQGKIDFAGNVMTVLSGAGQGRSYVLEPAAHFLRVVGTEGDAHGFLHRVKTEATLRALGAEVMADAVVLGDVAYQVEPGFLAESAALQAAAASRADPARAAGRAPDGAPGAGPTGDAGAPTAQELDDRRKEAEDLARFLVNDSS